MKSKHLLFSVGLMAVLITPEANAQITIESTDYPIAQAGYRSNYFWGHDSANYHVPTQGPNQVWDYQNIDITPNINADFEYFETTDPFFANTHHFEAGRVALGGFRVLTDVHLGSDITGYYSYGLEQHDTAFSLASVTGNAMDQLHFPDFKQYYTYDQDHVQFPLAYMNSWVNDFSRTIQFDITVAGFGLSAVPGFAKRNFIEIREVTGYGKLLMTDSTGATSDTMDVLLLKTNRTAIDSFFLGGAPAPAALLGALGLTQGVVSETFEYYFLRKGYGDVVLEFEAFSDDPNSPLLHFFVNRDGVKVASAVGIDELENQALTLFPNPVKAGGRLEITSEITDPLSTISVYTIGGKMVYRKENAFAGQSSTSFTLPDTLEPGVYFVQAQRADGQLLRSQKLLISE